MRPIRTPPLCAVVAAIALAFAALTSRLRRARPPPMTPEISEAEEAARRSARGVHPEVNTTRRPSTPAQETPRPLHALTLTPTPHPTPRP